MSPTNKSLLTPASSQGQHRISEKSGESYAAGDRDFLSPSPPLEGRTRDAKRGGSLGQRQRCHSGEAVKRQGTLGPPECLAFLPGALQSRQHALSDTSPLKLGQGSQDVKLQLPGWCRAVDALARRDERHPQSLEFFEQGYEVPEIPPEAVKSPRDQNVELSPFGIFDECVFCDNLRAWVSSPALGSARTRSFPRWAPAEWARSTARGTRGSVATLPSK